MRTRRHLDAHVLLHRRRTLGARRTAHVCRTLVHRSNDVLALETALTTYLQDRCLPHYGIVLNDYYAQYVGIVFEGRTLIYANLVHESIVDADTWAERVSVDRATSSAGRTCCPSSCVSEPCTHDNPCGRQAIAV